MQCFTWNTSPSRKTKAKPSHVHNQTRKHWGSAALKTGADFYGRRSKPEFPLTPPPPGEGGSPGALNIQPVNIEDEMRRSYLDYSMSVIIGRALPDVRDGLKPVHRRILYTMQEMGLQPNQEYTKCAKIVGHVMGNYHPHGDLAVYDTLVRLAQTVLPALSAD